MTWKAIMSVPGTTGLVVRGKTTAPGHVAGVDLQNRGTASAVVCFNTACCVRNQIEARSMGACVSGP